MTINNKNNTQLDVASEIISSSSVDNSATILKNHPNKPAVFMILLVNLGSPISLSKSAIARFLFRFLKDKRVVPLPKFVWYPILLGIILPFRSKRLLKEYTKLWQVANLNTSPLLHYTQTQAEHLQEYYNKQYLTSDIAKKLRLDLTSKYSELTNNNFELPIIVKYAFSYSMPDIDTSLREMHQEYQIDKLLVIPMYPQFSSTTTSAVFDNIMKFYSNKYYLPNLFFEQSFYNNKHYIQALVNSILQSWSNMQRKASVLIFSYHGIPENLIHKGDVYYSQCLITSSLVAKALNLTNDEYIVAFQSKFGKNKWLTPSTTDVLINLVKSNIKSVDIICNGFVCECLETLEEIAVLNKAVFYEHGGEYYNYIPCLNDNNDFNKILIDIVDKYI